MIVKVKAFKKPQFKKLLEYMLNDKDRLFDENKKSFLITYNLRGNSIDSWVKQYTENEKYRKVKRTDSVYLKHEILSWHKEDTKNISLEKLEDIAREYISLRNPRGMYVAVPHTDKDHLHIHICSSGIEYATGKSMWMGKKEFATLKKDIQNYQLQKYPELSHSTVEHGSNKENTVSDREYMFKKRTGKETNKEKLLSTLKKIYKQADSKEHFFSLLKEHNITTYIRGGKISGITFQNRKFRLKKLGYTEEKIQELDRSIERSKELGEMRERQRGEDLGRGR